MGFFDGLKKNSFKEVLLGVRSKDFAVRKAAGADVPETTQLEDIEAVSGKIEAGTSALASAPVLSEIPILGDALSGLNRGAQEVNILTSNINQAVDEQDRAAKSGGASVHHYANLGKAGIGAVKNLKKFNRRIESHLDHQARIDSAGRGSDQAGSRFLADLVDGLDGNL